MIVYIILGVVAVIFIGGSFYLVNDSRKRGMHIGGKMCGGCPNVELDKDKKGTKENK